MTARYVQHHRLVDNWYRQNHIRVPQAAQAKPRASHKRKDGRSWRQRKRDRQAYETLALLVALVLTGLAFAIF